MASIPMISHARHNDRGRALLVNQRFNAESEDDADELRIIGFASRDVSAKPAATYETRVLVADTAAAPAASASPAEPRVKRAYHRKDVGAK